MTEQQKANQRELIWRKAESNMARRERMRLIRSGRIVPAYRMQPQLMVRDANGRWVPELRIHRA